MHEISHLASCVGSAARCIALPKQSAYFLATTQHSAINMKRRTSTTKSSCRSGKVNPHRRCCLCVSLARAIANWFVRRAYFVAKIKCVLTSKFDTVMYLSTFAHSIHSSHRHMLICSPRFRLGRCTENKTLSAQITYNSRQTQADQYS